MPTVAMVHGIAIRFYYDDHDPPHFHAKTTEFEAKISLETMSIMEVSGRMRPRDISLVLQWARQNHAVLLQMWQAARRKDILAKLDSIP